MIYLDTSCLLKLLREEAESDALRHAVEAESEVVVSSLAELETEVQLKAAAVGVMKLGIDPAFPACLGKRKTNERFRVASLRV